ncbi:OsmC family protein [Virgibacillus sp. MSJ-26]|uniref:OsmC family protein n=1 Tax=Virgibacillus sp. MSJ-26 TaxID=2841522 RepID=UPI001C116C02|nr:OsmC family protein [Virgibacillus sp. MSJ-26]MBU5465208.1 OsmC family protein [Virgibacillus sp. MSJ-26]
MAEHHFHLKASWPGGRNSEGMIEAKNLKTKISIPKEMDGPEIGTNPDEMLLGAAATCYIITLAAMIERAKLPLKEMSLESIGIVDVTEGTFTYKKIIHQPTVALKEEANDKEYKLLEKLIQRAESSCMISRALKGNVEIKLEETIL